MVGRLNVPEIDDYRTSGYYCDCFSKETELPREIPQITPAFF